VWVSRVRSGSLNEKGARLGALQVRSDPDC